MSEGKNPQASIYQYLCRNVDGLKTKTLLMRRCTRWSLEDKAGAIEAGLANLKRIWSQNASFVVCSWPNGWTTFRRMRIIAPRVFCNLALASVVVWPLRCAVCLSRWSYRGTHLTVMTSTKLCLGSQYYKLTDCMACTAAYMPYPFSSFTGNCEVK
jgi:hypothetical protein